MSTSNPRRTFDVIIIGTGVAASTVAYECISKNWKVEHFCLYFSKSKRGTLEHKHTFLPTEVLGSFSFNLNGNNMFF